MSLNEIANKRAQAAQEREQARVCELKFLAAQERMKASEVCCGAGTELEKLVLRAAINTVAIVITGSTLV